MMLSPFLSKVQRHGKLKKQLEVFAMIFDLMRKIGFIDVISRKDPHLVDKN